MSIVFSFLVGYVLAFLFHKPADFKPKTSKCKIFEKNYMKMQNFALLLKRFRLYGIAFVNNQ